MGYDELEQHTKFDAQRAIEQQIGGFSRPSAQQQDQLPSPNRPDPPTALELQYHTRKLGHNRNGTTTKRDAKIGNLRLFQKSRRQLELFVAPAPSHPCFDSRRHQSTCQESHRINSLNPSMLTRVFYWHSLRGTYPPPSESPHLTVPTTKRAKQQIQSPEVPTVPPKPRSLPKTPRAQKQQPRLPPPRKPLSSSPSAPATSKLQYPPGLGRRSSQPHPIPSWRGPHPRDRRTLHHDTELRSYCL